MYNTYILFTHYFVYFRKVIIIAGWLLLAFLAYKVSQFDYESASFDPYDILNVPIVSIYNIQFISYKLFLLLLLFRELVKKL